MAEIAGLKLIVPSSVAGSGVSVSASGKVSFTAATSVSVNGVFDSTYDNYLVVSNWLGATGDDIVSLRLRVSGTDASGSDYARQFLLADNTTLSAVRVTSQTDINRLMYSSNTTQSGFHTYFYGPALAQPTAVRSVSAVGRSSAYINDAAGTHSLSTAYDGFTLLPVDSLTGSLTIYGLSQ